MKPETQSLLSTTDVSYDEYNAALLAIKQKLGTDRSAIFERVLAEELPLTTCRRAYRTAIMVACDEPKVYRETEHQKPVDQKGEKLKK